MDEKKILIAYREAKKTAFFWGDDIQKVDNLKDSDAIKKQDAIECAYYVGRAVMLNQILQNDFNNMSVEKDMKKLNEIKSSLFDVLGAEA